MCWYQKQFCNSRAMTKYSSLRWLSIVKPRSYSSFPSMRRPLCFSYIAWGWTSRIRRRRSQLNWIKQCLSTKSMGQKRLKNNCWKREKRKIFSTMTLMMTKIQSISEILLKTETKLALFLKAKSYLAIMMQRNQWLIAKIWTAKMIFTIKIIEIPETAMRGRKVIITWLRAYFQTDQV